jgi:hypothetical protein
MSRQKIQKLNIIRELRLRRWARIHFVPAEERSSTWHPVVLEEMAIRDLEFRRMDEQAQSITSQFVPLAPMPINILHPAHEKLAEPKLAKALQEVRKASKQV